MLLPTRDSIERLWADSLLGIVSYIEIDPVVSGDVSDNNKSQLGSGSLLASGFVASFLPLAAGEAGLVKPTTWAFPHRSPPC